MDIRGYFNKVRETERALPAPFVVVISNDTPDGGKAGQAVEVSRNLAAQMIVDGRARLASDVESSEFRDGIAAMIAKAEEERKAASVRFTLMTEDTIRLLQQGGKNKV